MYFVNLFNFCNQLEPVVQIALHKSAHITPAVPVEIAASNESVCGQICSRCKAAPFELFVDASIEAH